MASKKIQCQRGSACPFYKGGPCIFVHPEEDQYEKVVKQQASQRLTYESKPQKRLQNDNEDQIQANNIARNFGVSLPQTRSDIEYGLQSEQNSKQEKEQIKLKQVYTNENIDNDSNSDQTFQITTSLKSINQANLISQLINELQETKDIKITIKGIKLKDILAQKGNLNIVKCDPDNQIEDYQEDIEPYLVKLNQRHVLPKYVLESNIDEVTYQFKEQPNMNKIEKFLVFHWFYYSGVLQQALINNIDINPKVENFTYNFSGKDKNSLEKFLNVFSDNVNSLQFLKYQTYNLDSLKTLFDGLIKIKNKISQLFQIQEQEIQIDNTTNIPFNLFNQRSLYNYAKALHSKFYIYIAIKTKRPFNDLQSLVCKLVDGCFYRKLTTKSYTSNKKIKNVESKVRQLNKLFQSQQIIVTNPELNQWNQYQLDLKIIHWVFDSTFIDQVADSEIKIYFQKMFLGQQRVELNSKRKIKIWKDWLEEKYHLKYNVKIYEKKFKERIVLWINGDHSEVELMIDQLQYDLAINEVFQIQVPLQDQQISQIIEQKLRYSQIFNIELSVIESKFGNKIKIRMNSKIEERDVVSYRVIAQKQQGMNQLQQNLLEFTKLLRIASYQLNKQKLFDYLQIVNDLDFENQYDVIIFRKNQVEYLFFGLQHKINKIKEQIELFLSQETFKIKEIKINSKLIWQIMYQRYNQLALKQHMLNFNQYTHTISLRGSKAQTDISESHIHSEISKCRQSLKLLDSQLSECEIHFLYDHRKQQIEQLQKQLNCECILNKQEDTKKIKFCLEYESRRLILVNTKLILQKADFIVNPCSTKIFNSPNFFSGVTKDICQKAGIQYQKECKRMVKQFQALQPGEFFITESYQLENCTSIINVNIPNYTNGNNLSSDFKILDKVIQNIWAMSKQKIGYKLALPVLGSGSQCYFYRQVAQHLINSIIKYSNENETIYLVEEDPHKMDVLISILEILTSQTNVTIPLKYQWQWHDGKEFRNYDDWEILKQIDLNYQQYSQYNTPYRMEIQFPFSKQPGSHVVDLNKMQIISACNSEKIQKIYIDRQDNLYFDNELQSDEIKEYVLSRESGSEIFLNSYIIDFTKDEQINQRSGKRRKIRKFELDPQFKSYYENLERKNALTGVQFNKSSFYEKKEGIQKTSLHFYSNDPERSERMKQELQKLCKSSIIETYINIPKTENLINFQKLVALIQKETVSQFNIIQQGQNLKIKSFDENIDRIQRLIEQIKKANILPKNWYHNTQNYKKTRLTQESQEYLEVFNFYKKSFSNFHILEMNRIENKQLYEQYQSEKTRILSKNKSLGYNLKDDEKEQMIWHLIENNDPEIISQVGFQINLKNQNQCGEGIYFTNDPQVSCQNAQKVCVFCCKICTGRLLIKNKTIESIEEQYDTIQKQNTIVLGLEEISKAYPAYELILQRL